MDDTIFQYFETSLYSIGVPEDFLKLLKRIKSSLKIPPTVGNIIHLSPHEFQKTKGVGKKYVDDLVSLQNILPDLLRKYHSKRENEQGLVMDYTISDDRQTNFEDEFKALYDRLELNISDLKNLISRGLIEHNQVAKIKNINAELGKIDYSLQKMYSTFFSSHNTACIPESVYLNYFFFDAQEIKALKKLKSYLKRDVDLKSLLNLDLEALRVEKGFGNSTTKRIHNIINLVRNEFVKNSYEIDPKNLNRNILVPVKDVELYIPDLDSVILEDIESYLLTLNDVEIDIAMKRWGFHHEQETLEQIGVSYSMSRERIRQLEDAINNRLKRYLRVHPTILWNNFKVHLSPELPSMIPILSGCFSTHESLYYFLEVCFGLERGSIKNCIITDIRGNALDKYFAFFPSPASHRQLTKWLIDENFAKDAATANNFILQLENEGIVENTAEGFVPRSLNQADAASHVLTKHPEGLPWKDIVSIINTNRFTRNEISEQRLPRRIFDSENVYLSDRGTYRHVKFAKFDGVDIEEILLDILYFFDDINETSLHLYTDYFMQRQNDINVGYYSLRYIVRNHGEKHGIYFDGQSHVDTVSLHANADRVTLKDAILNVLKNSEKNLTVAEIAQATRSKNRILSLYTIQDLQQEGKVVRVDQRLYTTPEKGFQFIDKQGVLTEINNIIKSTSRIVESDVFREKINTVFNYSYSKYFYSSLALMNQKRFSWYYKNQLFCKQAFSYKSMIEIMDEVCRLECNKEENMAVVKDIVWLTNRTAGSAYYNWRHKQQTMQQNDTKREDFEPGAAH